MSSDRFPGKMLEELGGVPLVEYVYRRCGTSNAADVIVATSADPSDDRLYSYCADRGIGIMRGSLDNVLARYIEAAEGAGARFE